MPKLVHECVCGAPQPYWLPRLVHRLFFCPGAAARKHWVPRWNSDQAWEVGVSRCPRCLVHVRDPEFQKPCSGRRPPLVELP